MMNGFDGFQNIGELMILQNILPKDILVLIIPAIIFFDKFIKMYDTYSYRISKFLNINRNVSYALETPIVPIVHFDFRCEKPSYKLKFSKDFRAIIHYIQTNLDDLKFNRLWECLDENMDTMRGFNKKEDKFIYLPLYSKKTLIDKENQIYFELENNHDENKKMDYYVIYLTMSYSNKYNNMITILNFIEKCVKIYEEFLENQTKDKTQYIYNYISCFNDEGELKTKFEKFECVHSKDLEKNIFIEDKEQLINYIKPFINLEYSEKYTQQQIEYKEIVKSKYMKSGITFKGGLLFYGSPGCGKSSSIKGILKYTNRHGIMINLDKIRTAKELETIFRNTNYNGINYKREELCFILEDCDATKSSIIYSRKLKEEHKSVEEEKKDTENYNNDSPNLTTFLNILDGIVELNDIMIIMTTNHHELIDEALIRPGRFDFKYEFKKTSTKIITDMLMFKYDLSYETIKCHKYYDKLKDYKLSHAFVQSVMFQNDFDETMKILSNKCNE
jgi:hypothetical protein